MKYINKTKLCSVILIITLIFTFASAYSKNVHRDLSDSLLRLHIIADSDSERDQALKLAVRDRLIKDFGEIFSECGDADTALCKANENLGSIRDTAADELYRRGSDGDVSVETGMFAFPTKAYGEICLPAGRYKAVRVKIGKAKGHNWWCVMYPPLCFTNGTLKLSDSSRQKLKRSLSAADYKLITEAENGTLPVKLRFRLVELFSN